LEEFKRFITFAVKEKFCKVKRSDIELLIMFDGTTTTQGESSNLNKNENINTQINPSNKGFDTKIVDESKECDDNVCEDWEQLNQQVMPYCLFKIMNAS
jgi:hypothetical protein